MSIPSVEMNTGDLSPSIAVTMQNSDGTVFNLASCTVMFQMSQNGQILFSKPATVISPTLGIVQYNWSTGDTAYYGVCTGLFIVTLPTGDTQTFPTVGEFYIIFPLQPVTTPSTLPQYATVSQVMAHLNVQGPDSNGAYTVYGLPVSQQGIQAQVDHANTYISSLVQNVIPTDPRYPFAMLAALDMACMGVLVAASGGMLIGATDYRLGDLFITKATVGKFAYQSAVASFQSDLSRVLMNFSTVAIGAKANLGEQVPRYKGALITP